MSENNNRVRVLQVFSSLNMGGAESRMMDVFRNIDKEKFDFTFLSMQEDEQYFEKEIKALGGEVIKIAPPRKSGVFKNLKAIKDVIRKGHFSVVHAHTSFHCGMAMLAGWLAGAKIRISHARTTGSKNRSASNKIALTVGRILIAVFSNVRLAVSDNAGKYLFGRKKYFVLPNAIDCEKYFKTPEEIAAVLKNKYGIPAKSKCLGLIGRFDEMKNHGFAVSVFEAYHKTDPDAYLIFIGDGALRADIENRVKESGISDRVIFTGVQSNINEWLRVIDVLLVPSLFEGLPGVILEAQASQTPVIKSETITDEVDMNVGLIRSLPISSGVSCWVDGVDDALNSRCISTVADINKAFCDRGFSLSSEIEKLEKIYCGNNYENIDGHNHNL